MISMQPTSLFVEEMFYNGALFRNVNISEDGKYQMTITLEDDGTFNIDEILVYKGWCYFNEYYNNERLDD